jgi:hypothetical protein
MRIRSAFRMVGLSLAATLAVAIPIRQDQYQYMAICTEKQGHGGNEFALTAWLDDEQAANDAGKKRELETHGHRWRVDTRKKPDSSRISLSLD